MYLLDEYVEVCPCMDSESELVGIRSSVRESHKSDFEGTLMYKDYYKNIMEQTGHRPTKWHVPEGYHYSFFKYKKLFLEVLEPENAGKKVVMMIHGSAYVNYMCDAFCDFTVSYSKAAGNATVVCCDYRVAPEHTYDDLLNDLLTTYDWILKSDTKPEDVIICGDSSGGGSALGFLMYLRDHHLPMPGAAIALSPWANIRRDTNSYKEWAEMDCVMGTSKFLDKSANLIYQKNKIMNPYIFPLEGSFKGFPRLLIQVGTEEVVFDDSVTAAKLASQAGVDVKLEIYENMYHDFQMKRNFTKTTELAWENIEKFILKE